MHCSTTTGGWTDGRTDRQTDGFAIAYSALTMLSRAKNTLAYCAQQGVMRSQTQSHVRWACLTSSQDDTD